MRTALEATRFLQWVPAALSLSLAPAACRDPVTRPALLMGHSGGERGLRLARMVAEHPDEAPAKNAVFFLGRLLAEDFMEMFLNCAYGYGFAGLKLLRP